jgi:hypothetical protein
MTYNEELLKKRALSDTEKKNINLESTANYLTPTCTEKDLKISTMECEINSKVEDIRRLNQQIQVLSNDLKEFRDKNSALQIQIRELQHHIKEYDKNEEDPKRPNTGDRQTDITETTPPTRAAPNRRLVCFCTQSTSEAVSSIRLQSSYFAVIFNYIYKHFKANGFVLKNQKHENLSNYYINAAESFILIYNFLNFVSLIQFISSLLFFYQYATHFNIILLKMAQNSPVTPYKMFRSIHVWCFSCLHLCTIYAPPISPFMSIFQNEGNSTNYKVSCHVIYSSIFTSCAVSQTFPFLLSWRTNPIINISNILNCFCPSTHIMGVARLQV